MFNIIGTSSRIVFARSPSIRSIQEDGEFTIRNRYAKRYLSEEHYNMVQSLFIYPAPKVYDGNRLITYFELYEYNTFK